MYHNWLVHKIIMLFILCTMNKYSVVSFKCVRNGFDRQKYSASHSEMNFVEQVNGIALENQSFLDCSVCCEYSPKSSEWRNCLDPELRLKKKEVKFKSLQSLFLLVALKRWKRTMFQGMLCGLEDRKSFG